MSTKSQSVLSATGDYFDVFSLPRKLTIDVPALERQFYKLSRKLHPDLHAQASDNEQASILVQSSQLNDAYRTLKHPVTRVEYLLELLGARIHDSNGPKGADVPRVPADLLEEVFELNMQLEEMRANQKLGEDDSALRADLEKARALFTAQLAAVDDDLKRAGTAWDSALDHDDARDKEAILKKIAALLDRRGYLRNLVRDVNEVLETS